MLMALLRGKLSREQQNMEDILTSNVFGVMKYLESRSPMVPFLCKAIPPEGEQHPFANLSPDVMVEEYEFWPQVEALDGQGCEPDVLIRMACSDGTRFLVLVEAKYRSGKSSKARDGKRSNDQLALEWVNLMHLAERESREPVLVYLTDAFCCPVADIEASQKELAKHKREKARIVWLSWRHLWALIANEKHVMLRDLAFVLRHLNLTIFSGFSAINTPPCIQWRFSVSFDWRVDQVRGPLNWRFKR